MQQIKKNAKTNSRRGDTIVEAVIAIAIYSIVAVLAIASMNSGLKSAQKNLESTLSRAAIDSQVDSIRYIYENYIVSRTKGGGDADYYQAIWKQLIKDHKLEVHDADGERLKDYVHGLDSVAGGTCSDLMDADNNGGKSFVINARALYSPESVVTTEVSGAKFTNNINQVSDARNKVILSYKDGQIKTTPLSPRVIYNHLDNDSSNLDDSSILIGSNEGETDDSKLPSRVAKQSEGIWVVFVEDESYDFYVRTCWNAAGEKSPSTSTTVIRLYKAD